MVVAGVEVGVEFELEERSNLENVPTRPSMRVFGMSKNVLAMRTVPSLRQMQAKSTAIERGNWVRGLGWRARARGLIED